MKLFTYGSNMMLARILLRAPDAVRVDIGYVKGQVLEYNKIGSRRNGTHSGKANMEPSSNPNCVVWGVVYSIPESQFDEITDLEKGYETVNILVKTISNGVEHCKAHVAKLGNTDESLNPYHWYKDLVLAGAVQNGLPKDYINSIVKIASMPDPGGEKYRDARNARSILATI